MTRRPSFWAALMVGALAIPSPALADPRQAGKRVFQRCAACHSVDPKATPRFGPNLAGIVGRKVASAPGHTYSPAFKKQTFVWTEAQLDKWLRNPRALVPGTAMPFGGLSDAAERKAVIAYLKNPTP